MSINRVYRSAINNRHGLLEVLGKQGFRPVTHDKPVRLFDYHGKLRQDEAEIVIPRAQIGRSANDLGFKRQKDGSWHAIISDFDRRRFNDKWLKDLAGEVMETKAKQIATELGGEILERKTLPNGVTRLIYTQRG